MTKRVFVLKSSLFGEATMDDYIMGCFVHTNCDLIRKAWESLDIPDKSKAAWKAVKKEVVSIIHKPVWEQARAFQDVHGQYMKQSASSHRIPRQLLAAIIFTEMTHDPTPLWLDDYISLSMAPFHESISTGPGAMHTKHLKRWGYEGENFELGLKLHTDVHLAIDASARLLREEILNYRKKKIKNIELEFTRLFRGRHYVPPGWKSYTPELLHYSGDTRNIEREAWPAIAQMYNGGEYATGNIEYRRKFENSLKALGY